LLLGLSAAFLPATLGAEVVSPSLLVDKDTNVPVIVTLQEDVEPVRLGCSTTILGSSFSGYGDSPVLLDEMAVYSNALSAVIVAVHYDAATTINAGYATQFLADQPVGYWRMEDQ
jgi:hypothetical protein